MSEDRGHGDCRNADAASSGLEGDVFAQLIAPEGVEEFFETTWQREPRVFRAADPFLAGVAREDGGSASSSSPKAAACRPLPPQTWSDCLDMLTLAWGASPVRPPEGCDLLVFQGRQLTRSFEWSGPCSALLNGASCVVNHAEFVWKPFADLCMALRSKLLHVYCNSYVTPPAAQAVPAHADDRDVFILQILGSKHWRVYGNPPIKLPYTDEQVGKSGLEVPDSLLDSPPVIECILKPGDVLYMPRGFVHEACCPDQTSSWHATLAVATHDWSWTKVFASTIAMAMDAESSAHWRAAVPLSLGRELGPEDPADVDAPVEAEIQRFVDFVRKTASVPALRKRMMAKLESHNWNQVEAASSFHNDLSTCPPEERGAAPMQWGTRIVREDTRLRAANSEEEQELQAAIRRMGAKGKAKGLGKGGIAVREEVRPAALAALEALGQRKGEGLAVCEFEQAVSDPQDRAPFDALTQLCLARVGVAAGCLQVVRSEPESSPCMESADQIEKERYHTQVSACC